MPFSLQLKVNDNLQLRENKKKEALIERISFHKASLLCLHAIVPNSTLQ